MTLRTILVADEDETFVRTCQQDLAPDNDVLTAGSVGEAEEILRSVPIDLAILELRLGNESGLDILRSIRARSTKAQVAVISAYLSVAFAVAAMRLGADLVVFKPISCAEILEQLQTGVTNEPQEIDTPTLARAEWEHITRVLVQCEGNVSLAARRLGMYRQSLQRRLRKYPPRS